MTNIYEIAKRIGIEIKAHESDLYIPVNDTTKKLVDRYEFKCNVIVFHSHGTMWYEIPFAYTPFWENRQKIIK